MEEKGQYQKSLELLEYDHINETIIQSVLICGYVKAGHLINELKKARAIVKNNPILQYEVISKENMKLVLDKLLEEEYF